MKKLMTIAIATMTLASTAHAMTPVPPPPNGLVQMWVGGGMPVPGGLSQRTILITHDGVVSVKETRYGKDFNDIYAGRETTEYVLGQVLPQDLVELEKTAASINSRGLVKGKGPECMDAPAYNYQVVKPPFIIPVYAISSCRHQELKKKSERPAARALKTYLDQWNKLAQQKEFNP